MKQLFILLCLAFIGQVAIGQTALPSREITQDPISGPRKMEVERFSTQLSRLREACTSRNAQEMAVYESAILTAMRQAIEERNTTPLPLPTAALDLEKMEQIFTDFIVYTSFDATTAAETATKFGLLDAFQEVLARQYEGLK